MNIVLLSLLCASASQGAAPSLAPALADEGLPQAGLTFAFNPVEHDASWLSASELDITDETAAGDDNKPRFGERGAIRWSVGGGGAVDVRRGRNRLGQIGVGMSYFIVDRLSLDADLNVMYFDQSGSNAVGGNLNLLFRYHALMADSWSIYIDAGVGMLGTSDRVPSNGSHFNFVSQAGAGFSFDIGNDVRLLTGVRWHHISNANTHRDNPGRDSVLGYAAISFPF